MEFNHSVTPQRSSIWSGGPKRLVRLAALPVCIVVTANLASGAPLDPGWTWVWEATSSSLTSGTIEAPPGTPQSAFADTPAPYGQATLVENNNGSTSSFDAQVDAAAWHGAVANNSILSLNPAVGYTIEWRARLDSTDTTDGYASAALAWYDTAGQFWRLGLGRDLGDDQDSVQLLGVNNIVLAVTADIDPGFNIFRVVVNGSQATLFLDKTIELGSTAARTDIVSAPHVIFGDHTSTADSAFTIDYLRIYDLGAYVIPEPASLGVIVSLAGMLLARRKR